MNSTVLRTDIEKALDEIISNEEGMRFQGIAVVLAKQKWPDLIACERKKDLGLDAHADALVAHDGIGKGLASSITGTYEKIKGDAEDAKKHFKGLGVLIFATPVKVTNEKAAKWKDTLKKGADVEFGSSIFDKMWENAKTIVDPHAPEARTAWEIHHQLEDLFRRLPKRTFGGLQKAVAGKFDALQFKIASDLLG